MARFLLRAEQSELADHGRHFFIGPFARKVHGLRGLAGLHPRDPPRRGRAYDLRSQNVPRSADCATAEIAALAGIYTMPVGRRVLRDLAASLPPDWRGRALDRHAICKAKPRAVALPEMPSKGNVINLMEALKASIKTTGKSEPAVVAKPSKSAKKTAKPKRKVG